MVDAATVSCVALGRRQAVGTEIGGDTLEAARSLVIPDSHASAQANAVNDSDNS
jgi:hypothetical protein